MIPKETVDKIIDSSRIEEVVGDFIALKKRGVNLLGLCPFHGEKSPSFTVSAVKGIYKCFGCGKAGNSVNFIMDHEKLSYPEALKYLARKYNIEIVEKELSPEERAEVNEKESLYIVASYAQKYFTELLHNNDLGRSVGLGYFKERGFRDDIIEKFQLGYSLEERRHFSETAVKNGYKPEYLVKTGLSILSDKHVDGTPIEVKDIFDRYVNRVIFPIHSATGRVIGFGGRILTSDKKMAKYINSPQTDIYDKSKVLYGLFYAKKEIVNQDNCFLVEGYTDVISMHQAGIENVVSSSGTSLTVEQIKLIHRFTKNITILYDGDLAGIKASFRGIDLILEEGMNVKVLLFPDGDDPDSYSKKVSTEELKQFIKDNSQDFVRFKTEVLLEGTKNDPIEKAKIIKDIVSSIALIPDGISRTIYIQECARLMEISEDILNLEVNKIRKTSFGKKIQSSQSPETSVETPPDDFVPPEFEEQEIEHQFENQEKNLIRLLITYGSRIIEVDGKADTGEDVIYELSAAEFIIFELLHDNLELIDPVYSMILDDFINQMRVDTIPTEKYFINHPNPAIASVATRMASAEYNLSENWLKKYGVLVAKETDNLKKTIEHDLYIYKEKRLQRLIEQEKESLKVPLEDESLQNTLVEIKTLELLRARVNKLLGRTIIR